MKKTSHTGGARIEPLETRIAPAFTSGALDLGNLNGSDGFRFQGINIGGRTGGAVSGAGDVNGDGFDDFIIGADREAGEVADSGEAYVVFGKAGGFAAGALDGSNGFSISGLEFGDGVGASVSAAGDVNGDGFADVIVGGPEADAGPGGPFSNGAAYVIFGHSGPFAPSVMLSTLDGTNGFKLTGVAGGDNAGFSVGAADANGDGFSDLLIGAPDANGTGLSRGEVYVVYGKRAGFAASLALSSLNGPNGTRISGVANNDDLGFSVSAAGDVNGDGITDLILGADEADEGGTNRGAAYVVFGQAGGLGASPDLAQLNGVTGFKLAGVADSDFTGGAVSGAGDVNGDGLADLIVGANGANAGPDQRGASYVVYGKARFTSTPAPGFSIALGALDAESGFKISGLVDGDLAGDSVSAAGDVNGDGVDDLIIGASHEGASNSRRGAAYVIFGRAGGIPDGMALDWLDGALGFKITGSSPADYAGSSVSAAGDINGDGFADVIVGAPSDHGGGGVYGAAYVVLGGPSGIFTDITITGPKTATFTDADGDIVTVKVSRGTLTNANFKLIKANVNAPGAQMLNLTLDPTFEGADVSITARRAGGGDGVVNVGLIEALGVDLGKVTVSGDLGRIAAGDLDAVPGVKSLTVGSMGLFGGRTGDTGIGLASRIIGPVGAVKIAGDFQEAVLEIIDGAADGSGSLASFTVGGSVIGGAREGTGVVSAMSDPASKVGSIKIAGDLRGGAGDNSGQVRTAIMGSVTVGGSVIGGAGLSSGAMIGATSLGKVTLGGSLIGGDGQTSGSILAAGNMGKVTIKGDQIGGDGALSGAISTAYSTGDIASVTIGGDARGGRGGLGSGIFVGGKLGPVIIKGDVKSDAKAPYTIAVAAADTVNSLAMASLKVGGDFEGARVLAGTAFSNSNGRVQIGAISVGGDWIASNVSAGLLSHAGADGFSTLLGNGDDAFIAAGPATGVASIKSVTIKGAARGTFEEGDRFAIVAEQIGSVSIGGVMVPLTKSKTADPANDLAGFAVGATPDFVVREVSRMTAPPALPFTATPAAGPRSAQPGVVSLGSLTGVDGFKLSGVNNDDRAGSVNSAGDVNGDGFADFIIGAYRADEGGSDRGAAYVVFGKATGFGPSVALSGLNGTNGFKLSGLANDDQVGKAVSAAGDVNGDGFDDLLISAPGAEEGGTNRGAAYVIFGKASGFDASVSLSGLDGSNGFKLSDVNGYGTGVTLSAAGDVNGDGFADLLIGAPAAAEGGILRGAAYVVFGQAGGFGASVALEDLNGSNGFKLSGTTDGFQAGLSIGGGGDVNGDGFDDLIIGEPYAAEGGTKRGAAYVIFGKGGAFAANVPLSGLNGSDGFKLSGTTTSDQAGIGVSGAGDVNGDGLADVIVGTSFRNPGMAYVIFGQTGAFDPVIPLGTLNGSNGFKLTGSSDLEMGGSVSGAGDVNGDGFADLLIGASGLDLAGTDFGGAYVVYGKARFTDTPAPGFGLPLGNLDGSSGFKLTGVELNVTGEEVRGAGDVNGDGFADLLIAAKRAAEGGTERGAAYVVFGGPSGEFIDPTFSADFKTAKWTDVDGDLVTLKVTTKTGTLDATNFKLLAKSTADHRAQLLALNLAAEFEGADVSITAKRAGGGDGKVNVGAITGVLADLGNVTVGGDLGQIDAGDFDAVAPFKSLTVGSMGVFGGRTQDTGGNLRSDIFGPAGAVKVAGDVREVLLFFGNAGFAGSAASITIGGSLIGGQRAASGAIAGEVIGPVKIGGDLVGGSGAQSGFIQVSASLTSLTLGGSMLGAGGEFSGAVQSFSGVGNLTIGGSQIGGAGGASAAIFTGGSIGKISIKGDQIGGAGTASGLIFANGGSSNITSVSIGGEARGGDAVFSGGIAAGGTLGPVTIKGDVIGTAEQAYLIRGSGPLTGTQSVAIASVKVGGDFDHALVLAGYGQNNTPTNGHAQIGAISIGGDWIASSVTAGLLPVAGAFGPTGIFGDGDDTFIPAGAATNTASIASITIKGRAVGTLETGDRFGIVAESIGSVKIGGVKFDATTTPLPIGPTPDFVIREVTRVV